MKNISLFLVAVALLASPGFSDEPCPRPNRVIFKRDIVGLWMMGQSLCDGSESLPIVTTNDSGWGNYRFERGVRTWIYGNHVAMPEDRRDEQFTFVPLTAAKNGGLGETIANGLADHLKAASSDSDRNKLSRQIEAPHFLTAYAGQGGRFIDELSIVDQSTDPRTPKSR